MKVPQPIRALFQTFPLYTYAEDAPLPQEVHTGDYSTLYVHNTDSDGDSFDPKCLEAQCLIRRRQAGPEIGVEQSSSHISQTNWLPYLVRKQNDQIDVYKTHRAVVNNLVAEDDDTDPKVEMYRSLVEVALGDAWNYTLLNGPQARLKVYADYSHGAALPWVVQQGQSHNIMTQLLKGLETRYPKFVHRHYTNDKTAHLFKTLPIEQEVLDRAAECVEVFDKMLAQSTFLLNVSAPSPLDMLLYAYVHCISRVLPDSKLAGILTPNLHRHAENVHKYV